jgi:hypothetical protein
VTQHPKDPDADEESAPDLEYDLAHESSLAGEHASVADPANGPSVYVATQTDDYDGDYGYDLAHDVPRGSAAAGDGER